MNIDILSQSQQEAKYFGQSAANISVSTISMYIWHNAQSFYVYNVDPHWSLNLIEKDTICPSLFFQLSKPGAASVSNFGFWFIAGEIQSCPETGSGPFCWNFRVQLVFNNSNISNISNNNSNINGQNFDLRLIQKQPSWKKSYKLISKVHLYLIIYKYRIKSIPRS